MENKINNNKSLTHDCNVLYNPLNPMKHEKSKIFPLLPNTTGLYEHP